MASLSHILMLCAVITVGLACQPNIVRRTTTRRPTTRSTTTTTTTTTTSIPTGPAATDPAKERTFALEIQPPLAWSYPCTDDQTRLRRAAAEKQATTCDDAENRIREALEETINEITQENNRFSSVTVNLTSKSCLQANIATKVDEQCKKATGKDSDLHVVLSQNGYTIVGKCDIATGNTLPLSHIVDGLLISEKLLQSNDWDFMASTLKTSLSKYNLIVNRLTLKSPDHKIFKMTIQPPVSWSYPPSEDKKIALRAPRSTKVQAFSFDEARQNVITALQTQMNETIDDLQSLNLPWITVGLTEGLPVAARIVKLVTGKCPNVTNATLTVIDPDGGWRIWQQCNGTSEYPTNISIEVTGTLFPQNKSAAISELNWKKIAADLQNGLQYVEKVKFIKDITLEDGVPAAEATTAVSEEPTGAPETSEATTEEKTKVTQGETVSPTTELTNEETTEMYPIEEAGEERTLPDDGKTTDIFEVTTAQGENTAQTDATVGGETTVTNAGTSTEISPIPSSESSSASNQTVDSRKFSMEVQPPAAWSYPFTEDVTNDYGQAKTCEEAEERILAAFNAIIKVTADIDLQAVGAIVASRACLQANIATISGGLCKVSHASPLDVLLSQDGTIEKTCDANTGESGSFTPKKIEGSLVSEKVLTTDQWENLTQTLIDGLEKDYHLIFNTKLTLESSMGEPDKGSGNDAPRINVDLIAADFPSANDKERATFIMAVQPPAIWTYPSQIKFWRDDLQKKDEVEARKEIHNAIERAMYRVLKGYNIPEELLTVEINHNVKIAADIVDRSDLNTCTSVSDNSIVLNSYGKTIESSCSRNGKMKPYNQAFIRGTFKAELAASDDMWQILAVELKDQLEAKEDVIFPKGSTIIIKPF